MARLNALAAPAAAAMLALCAAGAPAFANELAADSAAKLDAVLAHERRDGDRARDEFRHPRETLAFFGIEPDMLVVEPMAGGGWYTRVLLPYLTPDGGYAGVSYSVEQREGSGQPLTDEQRAQVEGWPERFLASTAEWAPEGSPVAGAFLFGDIPDNIEGQADAVLFFRALHGLTRLGAVDGAIADAYAMLKPGGVVGVVQHKAREGAPDSYVDGSRGYLRQEDVIARFEAAGFVFEEASDINENPDDPADHEGGVWQLPPVGEGGEALAHIGESNRMTLRFRKPEM